MKSILLAIAIIVSVSCFGQKKTGILTRSPDTANVVFGVNSFEDPCKHIYVAVVSDTVEWDKTPRYSYPRIDTGLILNTISNYPHTIEIVCVKCRKVTQQAVKVINESTFRNGDNNLRITNDPIPGYFYRDSLGMLRPGHNSHRVTTEYNYTPNWILTDDSPSIPIPPIQLEMPTKKKRKIK